MKIIQGKTFCIEVGTVGGNANFELHTAVEGTAIELVTYFYIQPPEGTYDSPNQWGQVYQTVGIRTADIIISMTQGIDDTSEEQWRLQIEAVQ